MERASRKEGERQGGGGGAWEGEHPAFDGIRTASNDIMTASDY